MENQISVNHYKIFSLDFLKAYIITMRPYLMFVSGVTGIAGISFVQSLSDIKLILIFIASFLSYGFGQALTDCFQTDTDSISSPYRPLTQNVVSKKTFLVISTAGLTFCISVFAFYNLSNLLLGFTAGLGLATYTFFKRRWWGGPFYNAWIVVVLFLMAFLSSSESIIDSKAIFAILTIFFGYSNFVLSGYFKDIEADKATGYNTLPVVFGRKLSAIVSDAFAFLMIIFSALAVIQSSTYLTEITSSLAFLFIGFAFAIYAQIQLHKVNTDVQAHKAITPVVHSYILVLSGISLSNFPGWLIFTIIFYCGFLLTLKFRPTKQQV
jgi:4-hydroxybenzoate polyprenyltransferase